MIALAALSENTVIPKKLIDAATMKIAVMCSGPEKRRSNFTVLTALYSILVYEIRHRIQ